MHTSDPDGIPWGLFYPMIHRAYILGCGFFTILIFCSECIWIEYPVPYGPYSVGPIPDLRPRPLHSAYPIPTPATSHGRIGIMIMFISIRFDWILDLWLEGFIAFCNIEIPSPIHPTKRSIVPEWMPPNGRPRPSTNPRVFILRSWHHSSLSSTRSPTPSPESTTLVRSSSSVNAAFVSINLGFPSPAIRCIIYTSSIASCSLFLWFYEFHSSSYSIRDYPTDRISSPSTPLHGPHAVSGLFGHMVSIFRPYDPFIPSLIDCNLGSSVSSLHRHLVDS